jgi:hypothetical protein
MLIEGGEILLPFIATFLWFIFGSTLSGVMLRDSFKMGFIAVAITAVLTLAGCFWCASKF